ncbi:MAG: hypothetical protein A4S12_01515 [Proteobacteria bacterium SG_bin5]|nr:MAG: hypothetical protein A4S12_01515 [Proteobacteria bacterium SG_bin5]
MAGCNQADRRDTPAPNDVGESAAPAIRSVEGRSYRYDYAFAAPGAQIAVAQERHAQACEALGPDQCIVTSMTLDNDNPRNVHATLDLAIAPALARGFGSKASAALGQLGGRLIAARIDSEELQSRLTRLDEAQQGQQRDLVEIDRRLAQPGISQGERLQLQQRAEALRDKASAGRAETRSIRGQLAATPMHFDYRPLATGWFDGDSPLANGYAIGRDSVNALLAVLLLIVAGGLPWALLAIAALLLVRWGRKRLVTALG